MPQFRMSGQLNLCLATFSAARNIVIQAANAAHLKVFYNYLFFKINSLHTLACTKNVGKSVYE